MATLYSPSNVVVGLAYGQIAPGDTAAPADTLEPFTSWGTDWVSGGATNEGWKLGGESNTQDVNIEEQALPIDSNVESRTFTIEAALAEDTLESIRLAFGGGTITTDATTQVKTLTLATDLEVFAVGLEMKTVGNATRRIYVPRMKAGGEVSAEFRRVADKRMWPLAFNAICPLEEIVIKDIPAAA